MSTTQRKAKDHLGISNGQGNAGLGWSALTCCAVYARVGSGCSFPISLARCFASAVGYQPGVGGVGVVAGGQVLHPDWIFFVGVVVFPRRLKHPIHPGTLAPQVWRILRQYFHCIFIFIFFAELLSHPKPCVVPLCAFPRRTASPCRWERWAANREEGRRKQLSFFYELWKEQLIFSFFGARPGLGAEALLLRELC